MCIFPSLFLCHIYIGDLTQFINCKAAIFFFYRKCNSNNTLKNKNMVWSPSVEIAVPPWGPPSIAGPLESS